MRLFTPAFRDRLRFSIEATAMDEGY